MASSHSVLDAQVLDSLRTVEDPDLKKDLVSLGMIRDLRVTPEGAVSFRVVLTTPACPLKAKIEQDCKNAVTAVRGVSSVSITMDAEVRKQQAQAAGQGMRSIPGVGHIIAVSSGKGGVGKSTVAVNLATSLALEGARVGLMDADVYGPNIPTMLGVMDGPRIEQHPQRGEVFIPPTAPVLGAANGIKIMSMGFLIQGDQPLVWRGPMLHSVINQFCYQVDWGQLDYLIVDMPPGTGDVQLSLAQLVPVTGAVLVTTPQEVSLQDVRKAYHMFEKVRVPVLGIVENMSSFICDGCDKRHALFGTGGGKVLARKFGLDLLAELPMEPAVREGGDEGRPVVVSHPASVAARDLRAMATRVAQKVSVLEASKQSGAPEISIGRF